MVGTEGLGSQAHQAKRPPQGQGRRRAQARGYSAPHVDRRNGVQLVDEEGCRVAIPRHGGKSRPCRDGGGGEIVRFFACVQKDDRACNIGPPASSYAIMRRARPLYVAGLLSKYLLSSKENGEPLASLWRMSLCGRLGPVFPSFAVQTGRLSWDAQERRSCVQGCSKRSSCCGDEMEG